MILINLWFVSCFFVMDFEGLLRFERQKAKAAARAALEKRSAASSTSVLPGNELRGPTREAGVLRFDATFLSAEEAAAIETGLANVPPAEWSCLPKRRLLVLGGVPHPGGMISEPLPSFIQPLAERLAPLFGGEPNQVLVNEYEAGKGIDAHYDGPLFHSMAAIVSLQSSATLRFEEESSGKTVASVLMPPRSLVAFGGSSYYDSLRHSVPTVVDSEVLTDDVCVLNADCVAAWTTSAEDGGCRILPRSRRVSLTFRRVKHVAHAADEYIDLDLKKEAHRRLTWWVSATSETTTAAAVAAAGAANGGASSGHSAQRSG